MRLRLAVLATAALLAAAGCQSGSAPTVSATSPTPAVTTPTPTTPASTDAARPSPSSPSSPSSGDPAPSSPSPSTEPIPSRTTRTSINPKHPERTFTGSGARLITVDLRGDFGLALDLDCSRCRGPVVLTQPGRLTPWVQQKAPVSGQYIVSIMRADHHPEVIVRANGRWKLRLYDWNDSPRRTGAVHGTGSTIFFLSSDAPAIRYDYTPAGPDDRFSVRAPGTKEGQMRVFGTDEAAHDERIELDLPALVIVHTRGTWTIRPTK